MLRLILWLPFFCLPILAQNVTGSITGAVLDKSGSQIPAVNVKLTSETTAATREAATDPSGNSSSCTCSFPEEEHLHLSSRHVGNHLPG